jgi:hypothetical protein
MTQSSRDDIDGLGDKLASLELSAGERAVLLQLIDAAGGTDDDVAGFSGLLQGDLLALRQKVLVPSPGLGLSGTDLGSGR